MSRSLVCPAVGKAPLGQLKACSTEKEASQAHLNGRALGNQPCLKLTASLNVLLWRVNPFFSSGKVVSQVEETFSLVNSTCLLRLSSTCRFATHSS